MQTLHATTLRTTKALHATTATIKAKQLLRNKQTNPAHRFILPAVVIGGKSNAGITKPRLLGQAYLRHRRHVDDVARPRTEYVALRFAGEARPLDSDSRSRLVAPQPQILRSVDEDRSRSLAEGAVHLHVADPGRTEAVSVVESGLPAVGAVHELVEDEDVPGAHILAQGPAGGGGQHVRAALQAQRLNVGTVVDEGGHQVMLATVPEWKSLPS